MRPSPGRWRNPRRPGSAVQQGARVPSDACTCLMADAFLRRPRRSAAQCGVHGNRAPAMIEVTLACYRGTCPPTPTLPPACPSQPESDKPTTPAQTHCAVNCKTSCLRWVDPPTIWAHHALTMNGWKCRDPGSNRGPSDLRSDALPTELSRQSPHFQICKYTTSSRPDTSFFVGVARSENPTQHRRKQRLQKAACRPEIFYLFLRQIGIAMTLPSRI